MGVHKVNAWLNVSILIEIALPISPYNCFLNDSNGYGCYFFKCYYSNVWIIHAQSPTNLSKYMWNFVFNITDAIFKFESLKRKPMKSKWIMPM
jgi:hypothetical protein